MAAVEAKLRFTRIRNEVATLESARNPRKGSISTLREYSERWTVYVCPVCSTETGFEWRDFEIHAGRNQSNSAIEDQRQIEVEAKPPLKDKNSFVDFYCSGCKQAVRTYFCIGVTGKGESTIELDLTVEVAPVKRTGEEIVE